MQMKISIEILSLKTNQIFLVRCAVLSTCIGKHCFGETEQQNIFSFYETVTKMFSNHTLVILADFSMVVTEIIKNIQD